MGYAGWWLGVTVTLASAALVACTPTPRDDLTGSWEMRISPQDACGFEVSDLPTAVVIPMGSSCRNAGTWRWELTPIADPRTDERRYGFELWHNGVLDVYGNMAFTATELAIADEGGPSSCSSFTGISGRYNWELRDNELWVTLISDPCSLWRIFVTGRPWARVN